MAGGCEEDVGRGRYRFAIDTGGTFTDLLVEDADGAQHMFKVPTTPSDPVQGVLEVLGAAAASLALDDRTFLSRGRMLLHGTTHALNALVSGRTARTALVVTAGHPDILVMREGGERENPFDFTRPYPPPFVPRALTFELAERVGRGGEIVVPLDPRSLDQVVAGIAAARVKAVAVCLLWSPVQPAHELVVGRRLAQELPGVAVTLSHQLNPVLREARRAMSSAIDAALKPLMTRYFGGLEVRLREAGFAGQLLIATSQGGVTEVSEAAAAPIRVVNSGPSAAPVAGGWFAGLEKASRTVIVADTGGTTYDVSLVQDGRAALTRNGRVAGLATGFPSVDVRSVGAGGGSVASVDPGGVLNVGPRSAGASPGPAAYGKGGTEPTVTDASVVLGHLDPESFLEGGMRLDRDAACTAVSTLGKRLGVGLEAAADAILAVVTENMVQAILDVTVGQGIDPRTAVLVGGGGAAGLNAVRIAGRLGCARLLMPACGAALSAAGALMSDLKATYDAALHVRSDGFDRAAVNSMLAVLEARCMAFAQAACVPPDARRVAVWADARYTNQAWEVTTPVPVRRFDTAADERALWEAFHATHRRQFGIEDRASAIEVVAWTAEIACSIAPPPRDAPIACRRSFAARRRPCWFAGTGWVETDIVPLHALDAGRTISGPAIVEAGLTTVVLDPGAVAVMSVHGSLMIEPRPAAMAIAS